MLARACSAATIASTLSSVKIELQDELGLKFGMSLEDDDDLHLPDIHQLLEEEEEEAPLWDEVPAPRARPEEPRIVSVTELEPAKESAAAPAVVVAAAVAPPLMVPVQV